VTVTRNIRRSGAITALAAVLMVRHGRRDRPIHEIQITASQHAFDPVTIQVNAGEPVRIVIRSNAVGTASRFRS